jgi:hypothetical protein
MKIEVYGAVGTRIRLDGQEYRLVALDLYEGRDGKACEVAYWRSRCAEPDCNVEIEAIDRVGRIGLTRRCPQHAKPGVRVRSPKSRRR